MNYSCNQGEHNNITDRTADIYNICGYLPKLEAALDLIQDVIDLLPVGGKAYHLAEDCMYCIDRMIGDEEEKQQEQRERDAMW